MAVPFGGGRETKNDLRRLPQAHVPFTAVRYILDSFVDAPLRIAIAGCSHHLYFHCGRRQYIPGDADDRDRFGIGLGCTPLQAGLQILGHPLRIFADLFHPDSTLPAGINGREDDPLHAVLFADRFHGDRIHRRSGRGCRNLRFHEFRLHSDRDLRDAVCAGGYGITKYRIFAFVLLVSVNQVWDFAVGIVTVVSLFAIILTILPRKGRRQPAHNKHPNKEKAENVTGSKGYFFNTGQHQFIFGTGKVNEVYDEFKQYTKMDESADTAFKEDVYSNMTPKSTTGFEVGIVSE